MNQEIRVAELLKFGYQNFRSLDTPLRNGKKKKRSVKTNSKMQRAKEVKNKQRIKLSNTSRSENDNSAKIIKHTRSNIKQKAFEVTTPILKTLHLT